MKNILKKLIYLQLFLFILNGIIFAESYTIDYYGIVVQSLDNNMAKMTSDLYYTQLTELSNFTINDKRTTPSRTTKPDFSTLSTKNLIFYAEIEKNEDTEKWEVTFSIFDKPANQQYSKSKIYDSFYKILMESKNELHNIITDLVTEKPELKSNDKNESENITSSNTETSLSTTKKIKVSSPGELSGTWHGENSIDKIVLLRGGRGFVIFKNGASMNITVQIENNGETIIFKQNGNSNASFYPELPRNIALDAAISAPPIKWTMTLVNKNTLQGNKTTLVPDNTSFKVGEITVTWKKD